MREATWQLVNRINNSRDCLFNVINNSNIPYTLSLALSRYIDPSLTVVDMPSGIPTSSRRPRSSMGPLDVTGAEGISPQKVDLECQYLVPGRQWSSTVY